jgi:hydrogenase maturation protease
LGNAFRGDDAVGLVAAELCRERLNGSVKIHTSVSDASSLPELWTRADLCIVIDCALSGSPAGTVHRIDGLAGKIPAQFSSAFSTHALSVGQGLELGRVLGKLPRRLLIFGIEGTCFTCGASMSHEVKEAAIRVAQAISEEIDVSSPEVTHE